MFKSLQFNGQVTLIAAIIGFLLSYSATTSGSTPLIASQGSDTVSQTGLLLILALGLGVVVTALSYRRQQPTKAIKQHTDIVAIPVRNNTTARLATSLAAGLLLFAGTALVMYLIHFFFQGVTLNRLLVVIITTSYSALAAFGLSWWAARLDTVNLLVLAGLVMITGIVIAALAVGDAAWWQRSLSYLGSTETAGFYFNIALIIAGLLVLVVNQETLAIVRGLVAAELLSPDYARWARLYMLAIPVCIIGIGLFPTRINPLSDLLHNLSSHLMVVFFVILMLSTVNRRDSFHSASFQRLSRLSAWAIIVFFAFEKLEIVNFVAFELIIIVPIGAWLALYQVQVYQFAKSGKAPDVQVRRPETPLGIYALRTAFITATLGAIVAIGYTEPQTLIPFIESDAPITITDLWSILGFVLGIGVSAIAYQRFATDRPELSEAERELLQSRNKWLARSVVSLAAGVIVFTATLALAVVVDVVFPNVAMNALAAIAITAAYGGVLGFGLAYWAGSLTGVNLLVLAGVTVFLGIGAAALFIGDPEWWRVSLSYLGSAASPVSLFFNVGLILTGLILLIVNQDSIGLLRILSDDAKLSQDYVMHVRWLLVLIPLFLMGVGLFPRRISDLYDLLHNLSATAMVLCFLFLAFFVVAGHEAIHPRRFARQSRLLSVVVLLLFGTYSLSIVNYVGFELLLFVPIGIWLVLYQIELQRIARGGDLPVPSAQTLQSA